MKPAENSYRSVLKIPVVRKSGESLWWFAQRVADLPIRGIDECRPHAHMDKVDCITSYLPAGIEEDLKKIDGGNLSLTLKDCSLANM
ncbi:hypothetical protein KJ865_00725, partial [Myxococcota bacterium]|nr:hypothetical protein [Myxococcota bacterium]